MSDEVEAELAVRVEWLEVAVQTLIDIMRFNAGNVHGGICRLQEASIEDLRHDIELKRGQRQCE